MNRVPMHVRENLEFDVMRIDDELLDVNRAVSKSLFRLRACGVEGRAETGFVMRGAHATTATARDRFDHERITNPARDLQCLLLRLDNSVTARRHGNSGFAGMGARGILVAHRMHRAGRRPDELDLAALAHFGEVRVLGEKTVAGMDRIDVAYFRGAHDAIDLQVTFGTGRCADANRFIGQLDVERIDIRFRINSERPDSQLLASADDAQGNLAPIRDENFLKHSSASLPAAERDQPSCKLRYFTRKRTWPNWTGLPFSATTSAITPFISALISFMTFIASMMQTTLSSVTSLPTSTNEGLSGDPAR